MSKVYNIEMDEHQVKLVYNALHSLVDHQMAIAEVESQHPEVVHLVHDCLALKRILNQIKIQHGTST
jgi:hypothetical protein